MVVEVDELIATQGRRVIGTIDDREMNGGGRLRHGEATVAETIDTMDVGESVRHHLMARVIITAPPNATSSTCH